MNLCIYYYVYLFMNLFIYLFIYYLFIYLFTIMYTIIGIFVFGKIIKLLSIKQNFLI